MLNELRPFCARSAHASLVTKPTAGRSAQPPRPFLPRCANYQESETEPRARRLKSAFALHQNIIKVLII